MTFGGTFRNSVGTAVTIPVLRDLQNSTSQISCALLELQAMVQVVQGLSVQQASWVVHLTEDDVDDEEEAVEEYNRVEG